MSANERERSYCWDCIGVYYVSVTVIYVMGGHTHKQLRAYRTVHMYCAVCGNVD